MKQCIIIGRPNVGKTLFALRFAEHLGVALARISFAEAGGKRWQSDYSVEGALGDLTSDTPHHTRHLQSFTLNMPAGKGHKQFYLIDTSGLVDGIHPDRALRLAMAQTLAAVRGAAVILHMMDAAAIGTDAGKDASDRSSGIGQIDGQVANFGHPRGGYLMLANKMDLPEAQEGLKRLRQRFSDHPIAPVSALQRQGFDEVKRFVRRHL